MPRSCGLMRPVAVTAVASVNTSAAPPTARLPRCTKCQSLAKPSTLEYSHIGETTIRFASVTPRRFSASNRCATGGSIDRRREDQIVLPLLSVPGSPERGRKLRPVPRAVHDDMDEALATGRLHMLHRLRKRHHVGPPRIVRGFEHTVQQRVRAVPLTQDSGARQGVEAIGWRQWIA